MPYPFIECYSHELHRRNAGGRIFAGTRKLLADILAGQNHITSAVEEYRLVIEDRNSDVQTKLAAANKSLELLQTLGRTEEAKEVISIVSMLQVQLQPELPALETNIN